MFRGFEVSPALLPDCTEKCKHMTMRKLRGDKSQVHEGPSTSWMSEQKTNGGGMPSCGGEMKSQGRMKDTVCRHSFVFNCVLSYHRIIIVPHKAK